MEITKELLAEKNIMSEDIFELFFGFDDYEASNLLDPYSSLPKTLGGVCLMYTELIFMYTIADAQSRDCTIRQNLADRKDAKLLSELERCWVNGNGYDIGVRERNFSFLIEYSLGGNEKFFTHRSRSCLMDAQRIYKSFTNPDNRELFCETDYFIDLLDSFTLLKNISFDKQNRQIIFRNGKKNLVMPCYPFIRFYDRDSKKDADDINRGLVYVLTSVEKGDRNFDLKLTVTELNPLGDSQKMFFRTQQTGKGDDEVLYQICSTVGLKTKWYTTEECFGDFGYIVTLASAMEKVISEIIPNNDTLTKDVRGRAIAKLFDFGGGEDFSGSVFGSVEKKGVDNLLYTLFVKYGIHKTIFSFIHTRPDIKSKNELFDDILNALSNSDEGDWHIDAETLAKYKDDCEKDIELHVENLESIFVKGSKKFRKREAELQAEVMTYYVLRAAGFKEKPGGYFGGIKSLDDYFEMIINSKTTIEQDLQSVLEFVICFYRALFRTGGLSADKNFKTLEYSQNFKQSYKSLKKVKSCFTEKYEYLEYLFDAFEDVAQQASTKSKGIFDYYIGRKNLCNPATIRWFKGSVVRALREDKGVSEAYIGKKVFISYCHKDKEMVTQYVNILKENNIEVLWDDTDFHEGQNWFERAKELIKECDIVLLFMSRQSVIKDAVEIEFAYAEKTAEAKYERDSAEGRAENKTKEDYVNAFIQVLNLEPKRVREYALEQNCEKTGPESEIANEFKKKIGGRKITVPFGKKDFIAYVTKYLIGENPDRSIKSTELHKIVANFYLFLRTSDQRDGVCGDSDGDWECKSYEDTEKEFNSSHKSASDYCIYPMVTSVRETRYKRDNVTLMVYETIDKSRDKDEAPSFILSAQKLNADEYYCVPNYKRVANDFDWMINPLLISCSLCDVQEE